MADAPAEPDRAPGAPHPSETARLFGQEAAERAILNAWAEGRLHHAWLLRGIPGIGKATLAYRLARALIADGPVDGGLFGAPAPPVTLDPPSGCPVRTRILAGSEPRLKVLRRQINPKNGNPFTVIRVEDVRAVRSFLSLTAADGGWRAIIVDPAGDMNVAAANALLKSLEEPPPRTAFLLVSHEPGRLLPTIRSRCRTLDLGPLGPEPLAAALEQAGQEVPADSREALALLAGGSVGNALRLMQADGLALYRQLVEAFGSGRAIDRAAMVRLASGLQGRAQEGRYALTVELALRLAGRLARAAATGALEGEAAPGEARLAGAIATRPGQAALWAEAVSRIAAATHHAKAVNLDPGQTVLDMVLELDATAARAARC